MEQINSFKIEVFKNFFIRQPRCSNFYEGMDYSIGKERHWVALLRR